MVTDNSIQLVQNTVVGFKIENFYEPGGELKFKARGFMAFGKIFSSKAEFYQYLAKYQNIKIPKEYEDEDRDSKSNQENTHDNIEKKDE